MTVRYLVQDLFRIQGRGSVATGLLLEGVISAGDVLTVAGTSNQVRISFVDFHSRQTQEGLLVGLQIHPEDAAAVTAGSTLVTVGSP